MCNLQIGLEVNWSGFALNSLQPLNFLFTVYMHVSDYEAGLESAASTVRLNVKVNWTFPITLSSITKTMVYDDEVQDKDNK